MSRKAVMMVVFVMGGSKPFQRKIGRDARYSAPARNLAAAHAGFRSRDACVRCVLIRRR
jgi:hypothetical protein